ncbi:hypothetical protein [Stenotrophomonas sp. MMGLT7]|uniref:hypothetical protein n=1 Tax=Stenotrophomonas sp. MMGLT7 TaxID=2901227 RepID=UPI001E480908|nr:hypothetical protein [Stenotrophomonas sp. MMGLT7]MCD7099920.1 hypothetical protein [Stenotrophomonas sp. MMGLT7]
MTRSRYILGAQAVPLIAALALAGCNKPEQPAPEAPPPADTQPPPGEAPPPSDTQPPPTDGNPPPTDQPSQG